MSLALPQQGGLGRSLTWDNRAVNHQGQRSKEKGHEHGRQGEGTHDHGAWSVFCLEDKVSNAKLSEVQWEDTRF